MCQLSMNFVFLILLFQFYFEVCLNVTSAVCCRGDELTSVVWKQESRKSVWLINKWLVHVRIICIDPVCFLCAPPAVLRMNCSAASSPCSRVKPLQVITSTPEVGLRPIRIGVSWLCGVAAWFHFNCTRRRINLKKTVDYTNDPYLIINKYQFMINICNHFHIQLCCQVKKNRWVCFTHKHVPAFIIVKQMCP